MFVVKEILVVLFYFLEEMGIKVIPSDLMSVVGETVTFKCTSRSQVTWTFNTGELPRNAKTNIYKNGSLNQWLTITNVRITNSGNYRCYGEIGEGDNSKIYRDQGLLKVVGMK